jgi:hypothetical protein
MTLGISHLVRVRAESFAVSSVTPIATTGQKLPANIAVKPTMESPPLTLATASAAHSRITGKIPRRRVGPNDVTGGAVTASAFFTDARPPSALYRSSRRSAKKPSAAGVQVIWKATDDY